MLSLHRVPTFGQDDDTHGSLAIKINEKAVVKRVFGKSDQSYKNAHLQVNGVRKNYHSEFESP